MYSAIPLANFFDARSLTRGLFAASLALLSLFAQAAPTVSMTSPAANEVYSAPAALTLTANATPSSGTAIKQVAFYRGSTLIATVTAAPYTYIWASVGQGSYMLRAKATDNASVESWSGTVNVIVDAAGAKLYYLHTDHLDTPRVVTDETNKVIWRNLPLNEPFGNAPPDEDPDGDGQKFSLNLRFPGQLSASPE